ncbi:rRNA-processing protein UTP23 homolog [Rhodnius prolixus]|uniref:rRNA-processing protein UTP23 homolog n=3 Tax=Rhodnius TaxID=13248 RepID=R4G7R4_RHOPR
MRINRQKKVNKYLRFYINNFGFHKPYQVLIDGTFCFIALESKVNIHEQLPNYLGGDVKILTTPCAILETESLGPQVYGAMLILKQFPVHQCGHKDPVGASNCIRNMISRNNPNRYILATQDRDLQKIARRIPGTPLLYIHNRAPTLEQPSFKTSFIAQKKLRNSYCLSKSEKKTLKEYKTAVLGPEQPRRPRKKKKNGGPNPLSCKKKKKQATNQEISRKK